LQFVSVAGGLPAPGVASVTATIPLLRDSGVVMTVVQGILLAVSVVTFFYLAVAMFKPEWF
jgi:hypothetical protein